MSHDNILGFGPILNGKVLYIYMMGTFSGDTVVNHIDSRHIVFIEWGGPSCGYLISKRTARRYLACFAAVTAARNSALVLEVAVVD